MSQQAHGGERAPPPYPLACESLPGRARGVVEDVLRRVGELSRRFPGAARPPLPAVGGDTPPSRAGAGPAVPERRAAARSAGRGTATASAVAAPARDPRPPPPWRRRGTATASAVRGKHRGHPGRRPSPRTRRGASAPP